MDSYSQFHHGNLVVLAVREDLVVLGVLVHQEHHLGRCYPGYEEIAMVIEPSSVVSTSM